MLKYPQNTDITEESILELEELLGMTITVHDLNRIFCDSEGKSLLGARRQSHRRCPICMSSPRDVCIRHCMDKVNAMAGSSEKAYFVHECHMGVKEIVVPIRVKGLHAATLFSGKWKGSGKAGRRKDFTPEGYRKYCRLASPDSAEIRRIAGMLVIFSRGLTAWVGQEEDEVPRTRRSMIIKFIRKKIPSGMTLKDLSNHLHLSPSRTCHLVKEEFGMPLVKLLNRERMTVAKSILRSTDLPMSEISGLIGISSEYHFSRTFRRAVGTPPGKYRKNISRTIEK
ncbi:MAG: hypothetical protein A2X48_22750 [Lentisphaerae bacterium GWF2_49_21]|nr:MAG: hypothetical protein A2X48_22750 [Lentisphaerae bacterium GWF2_49_21]